MGDRPEYYAIDETCQECGETGAACDRCGHVTCDTCLVENGDCCICDFCPECVARWEDAQREGES